MKVAAEIIHRVVAARTSGDKALISRMAVDLREYGATASERDAIRALLTRGYGCGDIALYAEDALLEARLGIVGGEMARP